MSEITKVPYVSLIRINGKPILPPIITPELRKELLHYKHQAIKLEKRLKNCSELKKHLDELLEVQSNNTRPISQLTFGDNSHIEALDISDKSKEPRKLKNIHLSKDLIEVTQYNASGLKTICSNIKITDVDDETSIKLGCEKEGTKQNASNNFIDPQTDDNYRLRSASESRKETDIQKPNTPPKPRLIRSNSYTLESPSPILLEHLKKTSCNEYINTNFNSINNSRNWASLENNLASGDSSDFNSINTVFHKEINDNSPDKSSKDIEEIKSPTIEVYQTDISVQQITVNTNKASQSDLSKDDKRETFFNKNPFGVLEPDSELMNVLKDIPDIYATQIIELLKKQHIEQKERLERYDNFNEASDKVNLEDCRIQSNCESTQKYSEGSISSNQKISSPAASQSIQKTNDNLIDLTSLSVEHHSQSSNNHSRPNTAESCSSFNRPVSGKLRRSSTFSMSPSQSLYYSYTSDNETLPSRLTPLESGLEVEGDGQENIEIGVLRENDGYWEGIVRHESGTNGSCSRELFPEFDPVTINALKQEWAASVIGAYVKGYLTRRLIKTEKVQNVIATVKDVLTCALELHHSDQIDEKDVELHRRLINQLSAALYSFHDIFFDLSTPEQMLIIATDRQRKREKLKRPQSGRTGSGRSSVRSSRSTLNSGRSDKSVRSVNRSSSKHKLISESPQSLTKV